MKIFNVGDRVKFSFGLPALSCCMNGRRYTGAGVIVRRNLRRGVYVVDEGDGSLLNIRAFEIVRRTRKAPSQTSDR